MTKALPSHAPSPIPKSSDTSIATSRPSCARFSKPPSSAPPATRPPSRARSTTTSFSAPSPFTTSGRAPASPNSRLSPSIAKTPSPPARPATCRANLSPPAAQDAGAKDGTLVSHRWLGGNSLNAAYYKFDEQSQKLVEFLKDGIDGKGVLNVDIFALEKEQPATASPSEDTPAPANSGALIAPLGTVPFSVSPSDTLIADVVIQNKGIAHSYVPEQRDFYESWVNFTVKDSNGKVLTESGFIQPNGDLDPSAHSFTNRLVNVKGEINGLHEIWHNRVQAYNNTIQSGRSQLVRYRFRLPKAISGAVTITATIKYRRFDQRFIDFAITQTGLKEPKPYPQPIIEVASDLAHHRYWRKLPNGAAGPGENPEWMRWNNYGIALLDAFQYEASVHAFEHVADLRPDYADAYTNMAVVEIAWERYNDAKPDLAKALSLLPGDPRALYYRALVERNAGQINEAIADLQAMLAKYPLAKDGLRELGFSYYQAARLSSSPRSIRKTPGHRSRRPRRPLSARHPLPPPRRKAKGRNRVSQIRRPERRPHRQHLRPRIPAQTPRSRQRIRRVAHARSNRRPNQATNKDRIQIHPRRRLLANTINAPHHELTTN